MKANGPLPNWRELVREKLACLELDAVGEEVANHLEDVYEGGREQGLPEADAISAALDEVRDWRVLASKIYGAKEEEEMNQRTRSVWIPGMVSLIAASGALAMLEVWGVRPQTVSMWSGLQMLIYIPWIIAQPAFGATGAYLSRRLGGSRNERVIAGIFPSIAMLLAFCAIVAVVMALNIFGIGDHISRFTLVALALYILFWVVIPATALAVGVIPFLREASIRQAS
jgi:hypothetical protein